MYTIIVDCSSNFALEHGIHYFDTDNNLIKVTHLPTTEVAALVMSDNNITNVKLSGDTDFCLGIKEEIESKLALEYANREIKIEVI